MTSLPPSAVKDSLFLKKMQPRHSLGALLGVGWLVGIADTLRPNAAAHDIDDTLRALQIKDVLADGQWFNRHLPQITLPETYASPWSRLVDLPYVLLTKLFDVALPTEAALRVATLIWPAFLMLAFGVLIHATIRNLLGRDLRLIELIGLIVLFSQAALEFAPGRIDHHNVQFALMAGVAYALTCQPGWRMGAALGLLSAASIAVGLETAPLISVLALGLGLSACISSDHNRLRLIGFGAGLSVSTLILGLVLLGPSGMMSVHFDALSAPFIAALIGVGLICSVSPLVWPQFGLVVPRAILLRLASLAVPAAMLITSLIAAFPDSLNGPYQMIDPVSQAFWLDNVPTEHSGFTLVPQASKIALTILLCLSIGSVALATLTMLSSASTHRILWALMACAVLLAILQVRHMRLALLMAYIASPIAINFILARSDSLIKGLGIAGASMGVFLVIGFSPLGQTNEADAIAYTFMAGDTCEVADFSVLETVDPGRILAPFGIGFRILEADAGHTISAIPFHRASPGIRQMANAFTAKAGQPISAALDGIDYVVVCARDWDLPMGDVPLYKDLVQQTPRAGLTLVSPAAHGELLIYRVD